jgi:hypothetical protein
MTAVPKDTRGYIYCRIYAVLGMLVFFVCWCGVMYGFVVKRE